MREEEAALFVTSFLLTTCPWLARCATPLDDSCVLIVTRLRVYCVFVLWTGSSQDVRASVTQEWLEICRLDSFDILKLLGTESEMLG